MLGSNFQVQQTDTPAERTTKIFKKMDENGDGVLTKDEFIKGCMGDEQLFQMLTAEAGDQAE